MPPRVRGLAMFTALCATAMAGPAVAQADDFSSTAPGIPTVLAARGAQVLWSHYEGTRTTPSGTTEAVNRLYVGFGSNARPLGVTNDSGFYAGDLAIDSHGDEVAVYSLCTRAGGCQRFKYGLASNTQQQLSSGKCEEYEPLMEQGTSIWMNGPAVRRGVRCITGPYLQYPGRRPQPMHPPRRCRPYDLTGGIVACQRTVDVLDRTVPGEGGAPQRIYDQHDEIYALKLGQARWRLIARGDATLVAPDGLTGKSLLSPAVSGGYVYWERLIRYQDGTFRTDVMRAPATGGASAELDRAGRRWVHQSGGDSDFTFAVSNGALYYTVNDYSGLGVARIDPSDLVFR